MWTEPYQQSHTKVALLYPSTFFKGYSFSRDYQKIIYSTSAERRCTVQPLLQKQWEGLCEPKASMEAFIFAVLTSSQQLTVFHPVCLMDLMGSKSWHLLQSWVCSMPALRVDNLSRSGFCLIANRCQVGFFRFLRPRFHHSYLSLFRIKELITSLLLGISERTHNPSGKYECLYCLIMGRIRHTLLYWGNFHYHSCDCAQDVLSHHSASGEIHLMPMHTHPHTRFDLLSLWDVSICLLHIIALCGDAIGPQPLIMISSGWPAAEWELSAAGNFRRRGRVNVRDNTVVDRQAVWSLWLLASLIETDALLSWGTLWQMEAEIHRKKSAAHKVANFCLIISFGPGCLMFSPCCCDFALDSWHRLNIVQ